VAGAVAGALLVAFLLVLPFRDLQGPREQAFIPIVDTVLCLTDLITAVLLYAQFSVLRSRALLALAMGYLFTALIIVPHLLTFPGAFSPTGLLHAGLQSTVWLYVFWHFGLPPMVIAYALLKSPRREAIDIRQSVRASIVLSVTAITALVLVLTVLAAAYERILPSIMFDSTRAGSFWGRIAAPGILAVSLTSIALLWRRRSSTTTDRICFDLPRRRSIPRHGRGVSQHYPDSGLSWCGARQRRPGHGALANQRRRRERQCRVRQWYRLHDDDGGCADVPQRYREPDDRGALPHEKVITDVRGRAGSCRPFATVEIFSNHRYRSPL